MSPEALLAQARALLGPTAEPLAGVWPRAVALLGRQALEGAVREALLRRAPGTERASARARLLCLPEYVSTAVAHDASYLWSVLSRACHQHPYELAPTAGELTDWLTGVERVIRRLALAD
jgi:hypothetical protein